MATFNRPKLHFTPSRGWINDPNGMICVDGTYHLFAQHNPDDTVWGPMHWLHAVSADRLHWKETGIALAPDALGTIFSGSAARLGDGRLALMYTAHGECEQQCVAFSKDGVHFEKYAGNPVIANIGISDFRDPKLFWNERYGCWSCVVAAKDHLEFYRSDDLVKWTKTGEFRGDIAQFGDIYECPDCVKLIAPDGREAWVLIASMIFHGGEHGCRMRYCIGQFDGDAFHSTQEGSQPLAVEVGYDSYAGATYAGENVFTMWTSSASCPLPTPGYCGCLSLPRRLSLLSTKEGLRLAQTPILPEYEAKDFGGALPGATCVVEVEADGAFELTLRAKGEESLTICRTEDNRIETRRSVSAHFAQDAAYNKKNHTSTMRLREGKIRMQIVLDEWCAEIFADDGLYAHALLAFAEGGWTRVEGSKDVRVRAAELK